MTDDSGASGNRVLLTITQQELVAPVLERLVSAAAVQAALPVDRLINALSAVDALVSAISHALARDGTQAYSLGIYPGRLELAIDSLRDGQAEGVMAAARLPEVGDVFERVAASVTTSRNDDGTSLVMTLL